MLPILMTIAELGILGSSGLPCKFSSYWTCLPEILIDG
jgi:hypothetical protein